MKIKDAIEQGEFLGIEPDTEVEMSLADNLSTKGANTGEEPE